MDFFRFKNILLSRKRLLALILGSVLVAALVISLVLPKQYQAKATVIIDQSSADPITGLTLPVQLMAGYMTTQVEVIESHNVALKVADKLKLANDEKLRDKYKAAKSPQDIKDWLADNLLKKLNVSTAKESSLIEIGYRSENPQDAAEIANAFAGAYIQTVIELRTQAAKSNADWYDEQITQLRQNLEDARSALSSFQQAQGIVSADDRLDIENSRLAELARQQLESQSNTSELKSRNASLNSALARSNLESQQEVMNNSLVQSLKSDLAKAEARMAEFAKMYDVNHPKYRQVNAEVDSLKHKLDREIQLVLSNQANKVASAEKRDQLVSDALAKQKAKMLELKKQHDEIAVLSREVENAQFAYDTALKRLIQARMESEISQTNVAVLNPALQPEKPVKPKLMLNLVLAFFIGSLLSVGAALALEFKQPRVRIAQDLADRLELPVLATLEGKPPVSGLLGKSVY